MSRWSTGPALPLTGLGVLFVLYLLVIGPGEYLVLRRLDRLKWTWLTFPAWVAVFSMTAYGVVARSKSDVELVRHILVRDLAPGAESFSEELHAALFVTRTDTYRLTARAPGALPVPGGGGTAAFSSFQKSPPPSRIYYQGEAAVSDRVIKWSYLTATFLSASPADGAGLEAELDGDFAGRLIPRLGSDLEAAWLLVLIDGEPVVFPLGAVRDAVPIELRDVDPEPLDFDAWSDVPSQPSELSASLLAQSARRLLAVRRSENSPFDRLAGMLMDDPHPHHDWTALLERGGAIFVGWGHDPEPRVATLGFEAPTEGLVIYRVGIER